MAHFLYVTEVFCPWCYGFSPIISKIKDLYSLPFNVICGSLIDTPTTLLQRLERTPNVEAFIARMYSITKVRISDNYVKMLRSTQNDQIFMDSQKGGLLFYALKHFNEERSLEIMKDLQEILYGEGRDVLSEAVLEDICHKYAFNVHTVKTFMELSQTKERAHEETELSFEIMEDVVLYPTLYYIDDKENRYFISRGFIEYDACVALINAVILASEHNILPEDFEASKGFLLKNDTQEEGAMQNTNEQKIGTAQVVFSCSLDGKCE